MSEEGGLVHCVVAFVRALLPEHWAGRAGLRFRKTAEAIGKFTKENDLQLHNVAHETVVLGRRKLQGLANKEYAAAIKDFADAEDKKIEAELKRRSLASEVRKKEAEARKTEAEARHVEIENVDAELELLKKIQALGITLQPDAGGRLTVLRAPGTLVFENLSVRLLEERRKSVSEDATPE